jgi:hypothetical protein
MQDTEKIVYVEFDDDGHPHSAMTHETDRRGEISVNDYDVAISKRFGLLYHLSGFGGSEDTITLQQPMHRNEDGSLSPAELVYWVAPGIEVVGLEVYKQLETLPEPYTVETMFDGLHSINCEYGILWCRVCQDFMPDVIADYCEHIWYCHECEEANTPDEQCGHSQEIA